MRSYCAHSRWLSCELSKRYLENYSVHSLKCIEGSAALAVSVRIAVGRCCQTSQRSLQSSDMHESEHFETHLHWQKFALDTPVRRASCWCSVRLAGSQNLTDKHQVEIGSLAQTETSPADSEQLRVMQ